MFELEQALSVTGGTPPTFKLALFSLIAALLLSQVIAAVYVWTHRGLSYASSYVHAISIAAVITCMLLQAANNNLIAGIGIAGSLAVLRIRIALRDPRDLVFIFGGVAVGVACGVHGFTVALAGTLVFAGAALALSLTEAGRRDAFEGLLRFHGPVDAKAEQAIHAALRAHARRFALNTLREIRQGQAMEYAYQLRLEGAGERVAIVRALEEIEGVGGVTLYMQDSAEEL
ncbi:MAG TPA: DUF4956 domain-containing protein [Kofleriaceae bacterium]|nr:DUF4956 domain-containing protein [Kofleriaceae bacterium]